MMKNNKLNNTYKYKTEPETKVSVPVDKRWNREFIRRFTTLIAVFVFVAGSAQASLMLRQPSIKMLLKPGETVSNGIVLENASDGPLTVDVQLADTLDSNGKPVKRACADWIKLNETSFTIPAKSIKDLRYSVSVPKDTQGGYWTAIVYSYSGGQMAGPADMTFNIKMHVESPINVLISDTVKNDLSIGKIDVKYSGDKILKMEASIKNVGNCFTDVRPAFVIFDSKGDIVKSLKADTFKIYPDDEKQINYSGALNIPKGKNAVVGIFDFDGDSVKTIKKEFVVN
jgi:hypothetical protein